jgi:hypothetical protein
MLEVKLGRISLHAAGMLVASAAVFVTALVAAPSAEAHGGVSIGIGFGFPGFIGAHVYAPPIYYAPPCRLLPGALCGLWAAAGI